MLQLSLQRFETLAEQKYNSPNSKMRDAADAELSKFMDTENNSVGKICEVLYSVIERSNNSYAHLEVVNVIKSIWEKGKLSEQQEQSFATVTIKTILNRYFRLSQQSQVFLKELIPFTLFSHPTTWSSKVVGEILKPFTVSYCQEIINAASGTQQQTVLKSFPKAAEVILINALIDIPKTMSIGNSELFTDNNSDSAVEGSGGISIRQSILKVLKFVKSALLLGYGVVPLKSLDPEQMKACGIERGSLDALCMLLFTCVRTGKRFASGKDNTYKTIKRTLKNKIMICNLSGFSSLSSFNEDVLVNAFYSNKLNDTIDEEVCDYTSGSGLISDSCTIIDGNTINNNNGNNNNNNEDLGFNDNVYNGSSPSAASGINIGIDATNSFESNNDNGMTFPSLLGLTSHYITLYINHLMKTRDETCLAPLTALVGTLSRMAKRANNLSQSIVNTYALIANRAFETMLGVPSPQSNVTSPSVNYPIQPFNPNQNNESFSVFINQAPDVAHEMFMMTKNVFSMLSNSSYSSIGTLNTQLLVLLIFRMTEIVHLLVMNESLLEMWQSGMTAYATLIKCLCELTLIGKKKTKSYRYKTSDYPESGYDGNSKEDSVPQNLFPNGSTALQRVELIFDTTPNSLTTVFRCPNSQVQFPSDLSGSVPIPWVKTAVITSSSYVITLFTSQYGRYINSLYTQAERQGDATFSLPVVNKNGTVDHGPSSDRHIEESARSPLIEDCCPSDFWFILRILPVEELMSFTIQAEPMIQMLIDLTPRSTPEGLSKSPFNEAEYISIVGNTVNLAWMMAVISVALVLDVPLTMEYKVRTTKAVLMSIMAADTARKILGFNSPTIKYLETTIISSLRAIVGHHLSANYSNYDFITELGNSLGVEGLNSAEKEFADDMEMENDNNKLRSRLKLKQPKNITKILSKVYSIIISKLLVNINIYQQSSLQSHSVKLLHQIVRQLPPPSETVPMIEDIVNLLKLGPLHVLDSIIIDPNPAGRAVRLGKGLSGVIASILRSLRDINTSTGITSQMGLETTIVNMLIEHYDVIAKFAYEGSNIIELIKTFVSLRGFLPTLLRTPEYAFIIVKMFILYCPALDAVVENSLKNSTNTNNYVGFLSIIKFILKMFISILKSGIGDLMDSLRSNGSNSIDKGVNTVAYSSPYLHVSSILCSFVTALVTTQGKINNALKVLSERAALSPVVNPLILSSCICCSCNMVDLLMSNSQSGGTGIGYRQDSSFCLDMMVSEELLFPYLSGTLSLVPILHSLVGRNSSMSGANSEIVNRKKYLHTTIVTAADILSRFPFILLDNPNLDKNLVSFLYKESCSLIGMRVFGVGSGSANSTTSSDNLSLIVGLRSLLPLVTTALHCKRSFYSMNNMNQVGEDNDGPRMNLGATGFITPQMFVFIRDCCALKPDISNNTQDFVNGISSLIPPLTLVFKHVLMILLDRVSCSGDSAENGMISVLGSLLLLSVYKFYNANDRSNLWSVVSLGISTWAEKEDKTSSLLDSLKGVFDRISEDLKVRELDIQSVREEIFRISRKINK